MKIKSIILLVELEDGSIKQVQLDSSQVEAIRKIGITSSVVLSKTDLSSIIFINKKQ